MSELQRADTLIADAIHAANSGQHAESRRDRYQPLVYEIWLTHYYRRLNEIEKERAFA